MCLRTTHCKVDRSSASRVICTFCVVHLSQVSAQYKVFTLKARVLWIITYKQDVAPDTWKSSGIWDFQSNIDVVAKHLLNRGTILGGLETQTISPCCSTACPIWLTMNRRLLNGNSAASKISQNRGRLPGDQWSNSNSILDRSATTDLSGVDYLYNTPFHNLEREKLLQPTSRVTHVSRRPFKMGILRIRIICSNTCLNEEQQNVQTLQKRGWLLVTNKVCPFLLLLTYMYYM